MINVDACDVISTLAITNLETNGGAEQSFVAAKKERRQIFERTVCMRSYQSSIVVNRSAFHDNKVHVAVCDVGTCGSYL
jgi:hypothetical protein